MRLSARTRVKFGAWLSVRLTVRVRVRHRVGLCYFEG